LILAKVNNSRVHSYRIHYMSLCILLKLSYMVCGSISCVSSKLFAHLMPFQQASSYFCNQNTLNIQNWLAFILRVGVRSKYFAKINFERNISLFQNNKEKKKRTCFVKGWDVILKQNDRQFNTLLGSAFLAIFVFCQAFSITCHSEDVVVTIWPMTSSFTNLTCLMLTIL
jgi:hypothetical protein